MSTSSSAIQNLARQLLAEEPARAESSKDKVAQAVRVCERLCVPLKKLAGTAGFSSLLSRAVAQATRQVPSLERLRVTADGSLTGFDEIQANFGAPEIVRRAEIVLVAELLGLLVAIIGEHQTLTIVRKAWPDVLVGALCNDMEDKS